MSPPLKFIALAFNSWMSPDLWRYRPSHFLSSPLDKSASQTAPTKAQRWTDMWFAFHLSKRGAALEPNWHSNRSQRAEKEFYCKSSPWGTVGILWKSSYSWSLIISKLPICKIRLHLNTTFKSETWTRRLWSPGDTPAVCAEKYKWKGISGGKKEEKQKQTKRHSI